MLTLINSCILSSQLFFSGRLHLLLPPPTVLRRMFWGSDWVITKSKPFGMLKDVFVVLPMLVKYIHLHQPCVCVVTNVLIRTTLVCSILVNVRLQNPLCQQFLSRVASPVTCQYSGHTSADCIYTLTSGYALTKLLESMYIFSHEDPSAYKEMVIW